MRIQTPPCSLRTPSLSRFSNEPPQSPEISWDDRLMVGLSGAIPVVGGAMNLVYGGGVAALSQSWTLGGLALTGAAANFATVPLLATGNHLPALALMAVSGATMEYVHRNW